jgi:sialate O-acetylesterase
MNPLRISLLLTLGVLVAGSARADVTLPPAIADHMVLQADAAAPIFGTAAPGEAVAVEIAGQTQQAQADKSGKWLAKLKPLPAGGPFELKVSGRNTLVVKDVLVGEVWLASGQSNMSLPLPRTTDGAAVAAKAKRPTIRYLRYYADSPEAVRFKWVEISPETAPFISAACYYFAMDLQEKRKCPIGIIDNSVPGAVGRSFISREALEDDAELAGQVQTTASGENFEAGFRPLIPYGIRGVLWCQGEGDRDFPAVYASLLPALINDWRTFWSNEQLPVIIVQLANVFARTAEPAEGGDCLIRDVQLKTAQRVPNTALVVTIDIGAVDVHYPDKKSLGERLAIAARGLAYGEKIEISGPMFASATFEGGKAGG